MRVSTSTIVGAPPAEVFALLGDPGAMARAADPEAEVLDDRTGPDGSRHVSVRSKLPSGTTVERTTVVVEAVPNERIVTRSAAHSARGESEMRTGTRTDTERITTLSPHADGTLVETSTELRFRPALVGLIALFLRRRIRVELEASMAVVRSHFIDPESEAVEHEVTYAWTESDERSARAFLWMSSRYNQFWATLALLSVALFALGAIGPILMFSIAGTLPVLAVTAVLPWSRPGVEKQVRMRIGTHGLRFRREESELRGQLLAWSEVTGIAQRGRFVVLRGERMSSGRYLPRRAFADAPAALAALREHVAAVR